MEILIADDDPTSRALLGGLARKLGHTAVIKADGAEALAAFEEKQPDLVLIDGQMPVMDGYEATRRMRALDATRWIPILFVAGESDPNQIARALEAGADDYIIKPLHPVMLRAKLAAVERVRKLYAEGIEQKARLQAYHDTAEQEGRIAAHLLQKLINTEQLDDPLLECHVQPVATYSGDLVAAARSPRGVLHVMLADAVGHGLAAAINVLPIVPCFYSMTAKGFDLDMIAIELNRTLRHYMPVDRFVATTLISLDPQARRLKVWNGGNPEVLAFDESGAIMRRFPPKNLALGIMPEAAFDPVIEEFHYDRACQIFACSDGVVEDYGLTEGGTERQLRTERMLAETPPALRMKRMRGALAARTGEGSAQDDMTVVLIKGDAAVADLPAPPRLPAQWQFDITFEGADLREMDVVGHLIDVVSSLPGAHFHRRQLGVVLAELFANALDHGVLGLASGLKDGSDGFARFFEARADALERLTHGSIAVHLELQRGAGAGAALTVRLRDSGAGFKREATEAAAATQRHGRGIALVRALCASLEYNAAGNEVSAVYVMEEPAAEPLRAVA